MTKIAVFVGSLREQSHNKMVARTLERLLPEGVTFEYIDINMPLFSQDLEAEMPESVRIGKELVESADGVLFITPEYNRSIPGVLKNAIDWLSRPYGSNSFAGKPAGMLGVSIGQIGTAVAQSDLRHILGYLDMKILGQPEVYISNVGDVASEDGELVDGRVRQNLQSFIDKFITWL